MKDNLIDEERAKQEEAAQESLEQKIDRLGKFISLTWVLSLNTALVHHHAVQAILDTIKNSAIAKSV